MFVMLRHKFQNNMAQFFCYIFQHCWASTKQLFVTAWRR